MSLRAGQFIATARNFTCALLLTILFLFLPRYLSVTRGWWLAWSSLEPRFSGAFEIDIVQRAPQNIKLLRDHVGNLRKIGQLGNLSIHIPGTKHASPKHAAPLPTPTSSEADKVVEQDPSLRPGDMFRLKSVKFPGYELGITSVKLKDEYYYLGLRKVRLVMLCPSFHKRHLHRFCFDSVLLLRRLARATPRTTPGA